MTKITFLITILCLLAAGCAAPAASAPTPSPTPAATVATATPPAATAGAPGCTLPTIIAPTLPANQPGYTELDVGTGLHMTGTVQQIDLQTYRLKFSGLIQKPFELSYDELRCLPRISAATELICPGYFTDQVQWSGTPLKPLLERALIQDGAEMITLISADGYQASVPLAGALIDQNFLAYEWEGEPLPVLHGFPLRAVFPDQTGGKWVKWLVEIRVE